MAGRDARSRESGQATVEWVALIALIAVLFGALIASGLKPPGAGLAQAIFTRLICAVGDGAGCGGELRELAAAYGEEVAGLARDHLPTLVFGGGATLVPVDYRRCMDVECAAHPGGDIAAGSAADEPVVAFTRVVDCRSDNTVCNDRANGNLYIQYWFYYPESSTFDGVPVLEGKGHHPHDWESYQVRLRPNGEIDARASSHQGHNHSRGMVNWASDAGLGLVNRIAEKTGARPPGGWGEPSGSLFVSPGSQAGNVRDSAAWDASRAEPGSVRLIPLEEVSAEPGGSPDFSPITPPWRKRLWHDPEAAGTG